MNKQDTPISNTDNSEPLGTCEVCGDPILINQWIHATGDGETTKTYHGTCHRKYEAALNDERPDLARAMEIAQAGGFKVTGGKYAPEGVNIGERSSEHDTSRELAQPHPSNTEQFRNTPMKLWTSSGTVADKLREYAIRYNVPDRDERDYFTSTFLDELEALIATHTAEAVRAELRALQQTVFDLNAAGHITDMEDVVENRLEELNNPKGDV